MSPPDPGSWSRPVLLGAVVLVAWLLALASHVTGALSGLERETVDARFAVRGERPPPAGIVIVGVDEKSLEALNVRPPIPRARYAQLLDGLRAAGARLIALDVQFIGATDAANDRALLDAVGRNRPVLLATHDTARGPVPVPAGRREAPGAIPASVGIPTDPDGVVREMLYAPVELKSFAVRAAELARGGPVGEEGFTGNRAWIDFRGRPGTYPTHSLVDVLDGRVPAAAFRGRIVLVGLTDPVLKDVFATAASPTPMSGVEIHANALTTVLAGVPLRSTGGGVDVAVLLALALLPALGAVRLPSLVVLAGAIAVALAFLAAAQLAFGAGWIVPVVNPLLALVLATAGALGVDLLAERRRREALEAILGRLPGESPEFFISYRRDQSAWPARILRDELAKRFGDSSVFMDLDSISAGQEWPRRIEEAILDSSVVLVLVGPYWLEAKRPDGTRRIADSRDWVRLEIETALQRPEIAVVPVLLDGAPMPEDEDLPESLRPLRHRNAVTLSADDWDRGIDALVESIRAGRAHEFLARQRSSADAPG